MYLSRSNRSALRHDQEDMGIGMAEHLYGLRLSRKKPSQWFFSKPYLTKSRFKLELLFHIIYLLYAIGIIAIAEYMGEAHWDMLCRSFGA